MLKGASAIAWDPPACTGWSRDRPDVVLAVRGTIRGSDSSDALLERLGAVSEMKNIRYWSVSSGSWRPLVSEAFAIEGGDQSRRRPDLRAAELTSGREFLVRQNDPELGESTYRFRIRSADRDGVVYEWSNASKIRVHKMALFDPGDLKAVIYIQRLERDAWSYYSLMSASSALIRGNEKGLANRSVAMFRYLASIPTDSLPPPME
jgi:hypothetical protein